MECTLRLHRGLSLGCSYHSCSHLAVTFLKSSKENRRMFRKGNEFKPVPSCHFPGKSPYRRCGFESFHLDGNRVYQDLSQPGVIQRHPLPMRCGGMHRFPRTLLLTFLGTWCLICPVSGSETSHL